MPGKKPLIYVDNRELRSAVVRNLRKLDVVLKPKQLKVADFILSERVACERKTVNDFLSSVFNQRLFKQLGELSRSYDKPLLVLEGHPEALFWTRKVNPNAIRGVLASIAIDLGIPIIWTQDQAETAAMLFWIANREQILERRTPAIRAKQKVWTLAQQQEYLIAGLPHVSTKLSKRLLKKFKTPKNVFTANSERLIKVPKIGKEKAKKIRNLLTKRYKPE